MNDYFINDRFPERHGMSLMFESTNENSFTIYRKSLCLIYKGYEITVNSRLISSQSAKSISQNIFIYSCSHTFIGPFILEIRFHSLKNVPEH